MDIKFIYLFLNIKRVHIFYSVYSILLILSCGSCISLDPEPCNNPINKSIGVADTFSISPLKSVYNTEDKVIVSFMVDNLAKLQSDSRKDFNLYENTNEEGAIIYSGLENIQDLAHLISSSTNSIKINFGKEYNNGYVLKYNSNLKKYILELEITLLRKRVYTIEDFSFTLILGNRPNNAGKNCRYYNHFSSFTINPSISFEVR